MNPDSTILYWTLIILSGFLIGISKTGISGAGIIAIPIMAGLFGGKASTGFVLPLLIMADVFATLYYHRHASWNHVFRLLPWALAGILAGLLIGNFVSEMVFRRILAITVIISVILMLWQDLHRQETGVSENWLFAAILGFAGGFATMMANAAGPVLALYLLSMRLPKNSYIGTSAWFFFIINLTKVPLQLFVWKNISRETLWLDLLVFPSIIAGVVTGILLVKKIPENIFRYIIIGSTLISAFLLL